jgi:hypothetical protein
MNRQLLDGRLRSYLQERASEPMPIGMEQRIIRHGHEGSGGSPRRSWLWQAAGAAAIVLLALGIGLSVLYSRSQASPARHSVPITSPTPAPPPGGPAPAELRGQWRPPDGSAHLFIQPNGWVWGDANGEFVVLGDEIDFYNGKYCGIRLPGGVGRYRWTISGGLLRFTPLAPDPCADRPSTFAGPFTKVAGSH